MRNTVQTFSFRYDRPGYVHALQYITIPVPVQTFPLASAVQSFVNQFDCLLVKPPDRIRVPTDTIIIIVSFEFRIHCYLGSPIILSQTVYYRVKKNGSRRLRLRTRPLNVMEFIRRFLQHVLPTGFMKVRYYGFLHPGCSVSLEQIRVAVEAALGEKHVRIEITITRYVPQCPDCGGELEYVCSVLPYMFGPPGPG